MGAEQLFRDNLSLVDEVIDGVCRRRRVFAADAEDFASMVKVALIDDDYAVLRKYEGRSSLGTYLTIVVERLLCDLRSHDRGRWHPSAEAARMGEAGLLLETLVRRDGRAFDEAVVLVQSIDPALSRQDVAAMLERLPGRRPRRAAADLDEVCGDLPAADATDAPLLAHEARQLTDRASRVVRETLALFDVEDRSLLRMRFASGMRVSDISRMTRLPQRPLYRRLEDLLARLRRALQAAGISGGDAEDVLAGAQMSEVDLGLTEKTADRQSILDEQPKAAEESP